jgi:hypothetical protein
MDQEVVMADGVRFVAPGTGIKAEPTPLLEFLAGPHAELVAGVWPAPHKDFLALPAARRHVAAILLARGEEDRAGLARALERHRDSEIAVRLIGKHVPGLMKAMARLGETQWLACDYERLLDLLVEPEAGRVLRHMPQIQPPQLALIQALPSILREAAIVEMVPHVAAARDLALAFRLALVIQGEGKRVKLANAWRRAKDAPSLFEKAIDAMVPMRLAGPDKVPALAAPFERIVTRKALEALALEFRNCLRDFMQDIANGRMAVFAWRASPKLAVAIRWDPAGWRLAEAEAVGNEEAPQEALHEIVLAMRAAGVRTGPSTDRKSVV